MNEEVRKTMRQVAWLIMAVVAFFLLGQGVLVGYLYQLGPSDGSFLLRKTQAIQGWFGIQAIALAGFVLTAVAIVFGLFNFLITKEASARAEETRDICGELRRELLDTRELLANVERERAFLAVRRRTAYKLHTVWARKVTEDSTRKQELTGGSLQISNLLEACAAPDTREQAIAGLGSYLEGDYGDVVRTFLRELETVYVAVQTQILDRDLGQVRDQADLWGDIFTDLARRGLETGRHAPYAAGQGGADVAQDVVGQLDKFANMDSLPMSRVDIEPGDNGMTHGPD